VFTFLEETWREQAHLATLLYYGSLMVKVNYLRKLVQYVSEKEILPQ